MLLQLNLPTFSQFSLNVVETLLQPYSVSWDNCFRPTMLAGDLVCFELPCMITNATFMGFGPSQQRTITFNSKVYSIFQVMENTSRTDIQTTPNNTLNGLVHVENTS